MGKTNVFIGSFVGQIFTKHPLFAKALSSVLRWRAVLASAGEQLQRPGWNQLVC